MRARAFWTIGPGQGEIRSETLPALGPDQAMVRSLATGISRGTESLVFRGAVPANQHEAMRCPMQAGDFPFPVKYGYSAVGIVETGPDALLGRRVFCLHPHQDRFIAPMAMLTPIPDTVPTHRAVLAANMETAVNIAWDAQALPGERALVIGAGAVGLMVAFILAKVAGIVLTLVDRDPGRSALAAALGVPFALPDAAPAEAELIIHASGSPDALAFALDHAAFEARIIEASWFGDRAVPLRLGEAFHSRRLRLVSSQVGAIAAPMRGRRTYADRLALALHLLEDPLLDALLDGPSAFEDLARTMPDLFARPGAACHVVAYAQAV